MKTTLRTLTLVTGLIVGCGQDSSSGAGPNEWSVEGSDTGGSGDADAGAAETDAARSLDACEGAIGTVVAPGEARGTLESGRGSRSETSCAGAVDGRETSWTLVVDEPMDLRISTTYEGTDFSPVLTLHSGCDPSSDELACSSPLSRHPEGLSASIHRRFEPGRYTLVVDERTLLDYGDGGDYTIHVERAPLADSATCAGAIPLEAGVELRSGDALTGSSYAGDSCLDSGYDVLFYSVEVPAMHSARVIPTYEGAPENRAPYLSAADSCAPESCVTSGSSGGDLVVANPLEQAATYWVAVRNTYGFPYTLRAEIQPMQPNSACESAAFVAPGEALENQDISRGSAPEPVCERDSAAKLFYGSTVPANHRLWVDAGGVRLDARTSCEAPCERGVLVNEGDTPRDVVIEASGGVGAASIDYDLSVEAIELAPNRTCEGAAVIRPGDVMEGLDARSALDAPFDGGCELIERSLPLYYVLEVPLAQQARVVVRPHDPERSNFSVQAFEGTCAQHACVESFSDYFNAGATEASIVVRNQGEDPRRVLVAVTNGSRWGEQGFDLSVERVEP